MSLDEQPVLTIEKTEDETFYAMLDTCVWINLFLEYRNLIPLLSMLIEHGRIKIILPDVVESEWNRHREKKRQNRMQSFKDRRQNALSLKQHLSDEDKQTFVSTLSKLSDERISEIVDYELESVEQIMNHYSTIRVPLTDDAKRVAADLAFDKKKPFKQDGKTGIADALILLSVTEYVKENSLKKCIFITENSGDFAQSKKVRDKPHEDLKDVFEGLSILFTNQLGEALNHVEENTVPPEMIRQINLWEAYQAIQDSLLQASGRVTNFFTSIGEAALRTPIPSILETLAMVSPASIDLAAQLEQEQQRQLEEIEKASGYAKALQDMQFQEEEYQQQVDGIMNIFGSIRDSIRFEEEARARMLEELVNPITSAVDAAARMPENQTHDIEALIESLSSDALDLHNQAIGSGVESLINKTASADLLDSVQADNLLKDVIKSGHETQISELKNLMHPSMSFADALAAQANPLDSTESLKSLLASSLQDTVDVKNALENTSGLDRFGEELLTSPSELNGVDEEE